MDVSQAGRSRRKSRKAIDYGRDQEFSDDAFEDKEAAAAPAAPRKPRSSMPRKKKGADDDDDEEISLEYSSLPVYQATGPRHVEKGYDPSLPPIRERYSFMPEYEDDGSMKVEFILGRRPIVGDEKIVEDDDEEEELQINGNGEEDDDEDDDNDESDIDSDDGATSRKRVKPKQSTQKLKQTTRQSKRKNTSPGKVAARAMLPKIVEYEYLIKFKGRSYLHLEWKTATNLASMNKSAKTILRRFMKKLEAGLDENLEDYTVDSSFTEPGRILDEKEEDVFVELTDKELLEWEKEREIELVQEAEELDTKPESKNSEFPPQTAQKPDASNGLVENTNPTEDADLDLERPLTDIERIRKIVNKDGPYYPAIPGSDNPYRDGYVTEPPKKPRASYLFFQSVYRSQYNARYPDFSQSEVMTILGDTWRSMSEIEQAPYIQLAHEEASQHEKEKALLEKAQRPNELWQPMRRCRMLLDRLAADSFCLIFLEPVNLADFPDYSEYVDQPMDLGTIRGKLEKKKYLAPENFARDARRVWQNCKVYNQHGSAIWHVADYMSKQFERLYHAWVLAFRNRYIRWANPKARPWETTCRSCDGKCNTPESKTVMCDHCDAVYGLACLPVPLVEVPQGAWHCPECCGVVAHHDKVRMMSALTEQAARKRAEVGDVPKKLIKRKMVLVKWAGLGYEHCTWETQEDINDDAIIAEYRKSSGMCPDELMIPPFAVNEVLIKAPHVTASNASGVACMPELKSQLYAQSRALQFSRFGMEIPELLLKECGPQNKSLYDLNRDRSVTCDPVVMECLNDLVFMVARGETRNYLSFPGMNPPLHGEYDAIIPITEKGLMMNVGELQGSVAFLGYRQFPDGTRGPSEINHLVRSVGDKIISIDGKSTTGKAFKDVIDMLRESGKNQFCYMRFFESRYGGVDGKLCSLGDYGKFLFRDIGNRLKEDRRKLLSYRKEKVDVQPIIKQKKDEESDKSVDSVSASGESDSSSISEDELDADDRLLLKMEQVTPLSAKIESGGIGDNSFLSKEALPSSAGTKTSTKPDDDLNALVTGRAQETTRSLALRLIDVDVGYSSDEGGEDTRAWFLDGMDCTFSTTKDAIVFVDGPSVCSDDESEEDESDEAIMRSKKQDRPDKSDIPVKRNEFLTLGERSKLVAASAISKTAPSPSEFDNFPLLSLNSISTTEAEKGKEAGVEAGNDSDDPQSLSKISGKKSTAKVEQVSVETNEVLQVWASAAEAAATLQISLAEINEVLKGEYNEEIGDESGGYRWRFADENAEVTAKLPSKRGKKGKQAYLEFRDKLYDHEKPREYKGGHTLRDYQIDGVNWLASLWYKRNGCILADEMGLGKTVQIVCYVEHLHRVEKVRGPFLIVVPLSTVEHWRREFEGWTDLRTCVYHDRQREWRDVMREYEWYFKDRPRTPDYLKFDVLVTTYDTLIADFDILGLVPWRVAVVDEAHRLRNVKGKLLECMKFISQRGTLQHGFQSRVLMTGTPLQNNMQELWTLLNFIEPFKFPSLEQFMFSYGTMSNRDQVEGLQNAIAPFMLRRVKEDVAKDIPSKEETLIDVELTSIQKQYYRAIFEHNHTFLNMGASRASAPKLMNIQMELRKCCNHPFLLDGVEQRELERQHKEFLESGELNGLPPEEQQKIVHQAGYIKSSGKMVLLDKLLPKLRTEGHKVLIFSQMVKMLDLMSEFCDFRGFKYERLDGRIRGNERQKAIDRFNREEDSFVFLLSTRAGGVGINLTAADICIIFDSDWNPQNDVQAQARCHRIGQTKDVMIYRLITSRSFEQEMFDRASKKLGLEQAVLGTFGQDDDDGKPTNQEMEHLLKKGAYALIEDDDDIGRQFCEDDIDDILRQRTRTRVVEGAKTSTWLNKQGLVVSKSKFTADGADAAVDLEDPLFWQKVMPDFVTPTLLMNQLEELTVAFDRKTSGKSPPVKGKRGRKKKVLPCTQVAEEIDEKKEKINEEINDPEGDENEESDKDKEQKKAHKATKTDIKKVKKFLADLKSLMEDVCDQADEDALPQSEKAICQKLLLTISLKDKLFADDQRSYAKTMLARLEGDRRRRCRTSEGEFRFKKAKRGEAVGDATNASAIKNLLLIQGSKKKRKKRRGKLEMEEEEIENSHAQLDVDAGEDGDIHPSDSEQEVNWSDAEEDTYESRKKKGISKKEAKRRRAWGSDKDQAKAAGRPWPAIPRHALQTVLTDMLEEVMKIDATKGGMFSEPVPKDQFPDYYKVVKEPMDYGTMKLKLTNGEYRSAQQMQRDFILVMQNCIKYNANDSDIVMEARRQALSMPGLLRDVCVKNHMFLAEDGAVVEIFSDSEEKDKKGKETKLKRGRKKGSENKRGDDDEDEELGSPKARKNQKRKARSEERDEEINNRKDSQSDDYDSDENNIEPKKKKPRIRISVPKTKLSSASKTSKDDDDDKPVSSLGRGKQKKKRRLNQELNSLSEEPLIAKSEAQALKKKVKKSKKIQDGDAEDKIAIETPVPRKKGKKKEVAEPKIKEMEESEDEDGEVKESPVEIAQDKTEPADSAAAHIDKAQIKQKFDTLDGSFQAARVFFTARGPWALPATIQEDKGKEVAKILLSKMKKLDQYNLFAKPVSNDEAPGYSKIVKCPMDFRTIKEKFDRNDYGKGSNLVRVLFTDILLVMDNCALYNEKSSDVSKEAARILALLPETFASACIAVSSIGNGKGGKKKRL